MRLCTFGLLGSIQLNSESTVLGVPGLLLTFVGGFLRFLKVDVGKHDTFSVSLSKSECRFPSNARGSLRRAVSI